MSEIIKARPNRPDRRWQADLATMLQTPDCPRVVVVEYPEGAGKTHIARYLTERLLPGRRGWWHCMETSPGAMDWAGTWSGVFLDDPELEVESVRSALASRTAHGRDTVLVIMGADCSAVREELARSDLQWAHLTPGLVRQPQSYFYHCAGCCRPVWSGASHTCRGPEWGLP